MELLKIWKALFFCIFPFFFCFEIELFEGSIARGSTCLTSFGMWHSDKVPVQQVLYYPFLPFLSLALYSFHFLVFLCSVVASNSRNDPPQELAARLAKLVHAMGTPAKSFLYLEAFFATMNREWYVIDRLRCDSISFSQVILHRACVRACVLGIGV
jgi:hypothetical protein